MFNRTGARLVLLASTLFLACRPLDECTGDRCGALVIAAIGEPDNLLPPVTENVLSRDIHDQLFLKLADIGVGLNTVGDSGFVPQLADRWTWEDSLTLALHINSGAHWQDGPRVSAQDVAFSFDAYRDPRVNSPFASSLTRIGAVTARDSSTVVLKFRERYPEMFFTAVYYVRVLPQHLLAQLPRQSWAAAPFGRQPVGDGPYRFVRWTPGVSIELRADSAFFLGRPHIKRLIWRIEPDHPTAVNQVIGGEADAIQVLVTPDNVRRAHDEPRLALHNYPGTNYGFLGFNQRAFLNPNLAHPLFGSRDIRRAFAMALNREAMLRSVFGDLARLPPGPIPAAWPLWEPRARELPFDTVQANRILDEMSWRVGRDGVRRQGSVRLAFRLMVPTSSAVRRQYARLVQAQLRTIGVRVDLEELEGPVFGQRASTGQFDALIGIWDVDPSPATGMADLWTHAGIGGPNWVRYNNPAFDQLVSRASSGSGTPSQVHDLWRQALEAFNDDAPAVMLFATNNVAAVDRRVENVTIRPDSYWALVSSWNIPLDKLTPRDRAPASH